MDDIRAIALLMDNRNDTNWGSQATTNALVSLLKERFPSANITGVPRTATRPSKTFRGMVESLAPTLVESQRGAGPRGRIVEYLLTYRIASIWKKADLIVVNGEGTLHPQLQLKRWLPALYLLQKRWPRTLWIVNCSIDFLGSDQEPMFRKVLALADRVCVREAYSKMELDKAGFNAELCADCAYLTKPSNEASTILSQLGVKAPFAVVTGSVMSKGWPVDVQAKVVEHLKSKGLAVLFASSTIQDDVLYERVGRGLPLLTHKNADYHDLMAIQGSAQIVVGGRYHPTILAALMGTPFVALPSNTTKMDALMETLGTGRFFLGPESPDSILSSIDEALERESWFRTEVRARAEAQKPLARRNVFAD